GQPVEPALGKSIVDANILALNPPELAQPLPERVEEGRHIGRGPPPKKTDPRHLSRLLRLSGERRAEHCSPASHERAPVHRSPLRAARLAPGKAGARSAFAIRIRKRVETACVPRQDDAKHQPAYSAERMLARYWTGPSRVRTRDRSSIG